MGGTVARSTGFCTLLQKVRQQFRAPGSFHQGSEKSNSCYRRGYLGSAGCRRANVGGLMTEIPRASTQLLRETWKERGMELSNYRAPLTRNPSVTNGEIWAVIQPT